MNEKLRKKIFREKLLNCNFFQNVYCLDKETENDILDWMFNLQKYHGVTIGKFSDLFSKYNDISFPIKIASIGKDEFKILDNLKNEYYSFYSSKMTSYSIGSRKYPLDKEVVFFIDKESKIKIVEMGALQINEDGTNRPEIFTFYFDDKNTTALFQQDESMLEIVYSAQSQSFDEKVLNYLLGLVNSKREFNNVFEIFMQVRDIGKTKQLSIKSLKAQEILSEILVTEDIVEKYLYTEKKSDFEISLHKFLKPQNIDEFINKHSK